MSIEATNLVWSKSGAKGSARLVLLCIANHINRDGIAWPSIKKIADDTCVSERQVSRAIAELESINEIQVIEKGDGRGRSSVYKITIKGDKVSSYDDVIKDDTLSIKGDISSTKDDTLSIKGDKVSSQSLEPLTENRNEPLRGGDTPPNPFPFVPLGKTRNTDPSPADLRANAIAEVCGLKMSVPRHRDRCNSAAAQLNEFTPEYITERFSSPGGYWRSSDWRGIKGNRPTPEQVVDEISTSAHAPTYKSNGNGSHQPPERKLSNAEAGAVEYAAMRANLVRKP